jgi:hypothetical protein
MRKTDGKRERERGDGADDGKRGGDEYSYLRVRAGALVFVRHLGELVQTQ